MIFMFIFQCELVLTHVPIQEFESALMYRTAMMIESRNLFRTLFIQQLRYIKPQDHPPFFAGPVVACAHYTTSPSSYYDLLEVTPKASSAKIKAAYYRLSKKYHPDVNKESGAKNKFAMLSEAYEILGNKKNRALYDRGMLTPSNMSVSHQPPSEEVDQEYADFLKKRSGFRKKSDIPTGKTSIYDFDEFYRQHYGESFKQTYKDKQDYAKYEEELQRRHASERRNAFFYMIVLIGTAIAFALQKT